MSGGRVANYGVRSEIYPTHILPKKTTDYTVLSRDVFKLEPGGTQLSFWYRCAAQRAANGGLKNG